MIEYKNVALRYTEKYVLRDVNLRIENGEFMVLVGPSGSGKTTMLKIVNRLLEPTDGNIYMDGKRIKDYDERELRLSTGYVLQAIALFPNLTVAENIALIPEMKGWSKEEIAQKTEEILARVGLSVAEYGHRFPSELSGGADAALECVGTEAAVDQALGVLHNGGRMGFVGVPHYENRAIGSTFGQNTIIGGGPASVTTYDKQFLLKAVLDGDINPGRVFTSSYKLEDIDQAYKDMDERKTIKAMIVMD